MQYGRTLIDSNQTPLHPVSRSRRRLRTRRIQLTAAVLISALLQTGCALLPQEERLIDGQLITRRLQGTLGLRFMAAFPAPYTITMSDVVTSYSSRSLRQRVLVVAFDSSAATKQITGGLNRVPQAKIRVIERENMVILYKHAPGTPDLSDELASVLDGAPLTSTAS